MLLLLQRQRRRALCWRLTRVLDCDPKEGAVDQTQYLIAPPAHGTAKPQKCLTHYHMITVNHQQLARLLESQQQASRGVQYNPLGSQCSIARDAGFLCYCKSVQDGS